jgi:hypothetical protein
MDRRGDHHAHRDAVAPVRSRITNSARDLLPGNATISGSQRSMSCIAFRWA